MAIKNYSTTVAATKSASEIQQILAEAGARSVRISYDDKAQLEAVEFSIPIHRRMVHFRLPADWRRVLVVLEKEGVLPKTKLKPEHARNVAWRNVKDWIAAQMALLETEQVEMVQLFMPYAISPESGRPLFEEFKDWAALPENVQ